MTISFNIGISMQGQSVNWTVSIYKLPKNKRISFTTKNTK